MYLYLCITRNISLANLDEGVIMHSFFRLVSLLYKVVNRFDTIFIAGIYFSTSFIFFEPQFICDLPKALPAQHQIICLYQSSKRATSLAPSSTFTVLKFFSSSSLIFSRFWHYITSTPKLCLKKSSASNLEIL